MADEHISLDKLDLRLLRALGDHPRAGHLELSRLTGTSRMTVQARLERLERAGVIRGHGPYIDLPAAGFPVLAFVTVQIAQGALDEVAEGLRGIPAVLEAHATTGGDDLHLRVAAASHEDLQRALLRLNRLPSVVRSTSVIALAEVVGARTLPLLESVERPAPARVPSYRVTPKDDRPR
ncbi:DNA-binding Lrp family transcriptional regulator [Actinocorallia herbida]|uniref:DNA-binding Lrp family transcriptional regulator n=1 Tax=Actinocorallia herbida TaxID=58109 RepID=A0A3N1CTG6_9ACTN|nr:Lrp/AsnC family transcriptional regulator [Actinocorallia herbida]ROO84590.1 DNA-binding Lrp family transcriptional regulator [Actinocorallia herbida]